MHPHFTPAETLSFWSKIDRAGDCWIWQRACVRGGYGELWVHGKMWYAHRAAYALVHGPLPDGKHVLHRCDNPPCCRPSHLFLGTPYDNVQDMLAKKRDGYSTHPERVVHYGEAHGCAKLTATQVQQIRERYKPRGRGGPTLAELAQEFNVAISTIHHIITNYTWATTPIPQINTQRVRS